MKTCTKCGEAKPFAEFYSNRTGRDGLKSTCKVCSNAQSSVWRAENTERVASNKLTHRIANREKAKAKTAIWRSENPERAKAAVAVWRAENPEKVKAHATAYRIAKPEARKVHHQNRRARKKEAGGKLSAGLVGRLLKLQRGKCACCKRPLSDGYHVDHAFPLALGGANVDDNIQLLCPPCNLSKGAKHPIDFAQEAGRLL